MTMRLEIVEGVLQILSEEDGTHVSIYPRRSVAVGMTRIELGGPGLPPLHFIFEREYDDPKAAERWLWRGDTESALRIAQDIMREIDDVLERLAEVPSAEQSLQRRWCQALRERFPVTRLAPDFR
jgi:hypothetical protein